ncbi:MAG: sporulation integral membrane protein YlbJ [Bacillota bacterium]
MTGGKISTAVLCVIAITAVLSMVLKPNVAFQAAVDGLEVWWGVVFPALLPFFIGSQILLGLGVVHAMGVVLEPVMRPLFNVPGCGSFVLAMGLASGYPIGAVLTGNLRRESMLNKYEGERLVSAANTADPLFMSGAVAVGMFGNPDVAALIMIAHYITALINGLIIRFHAPSAPRTIQPSSAKGPAYAPLYARAIRALFEARERDGRPLGSILGDAVRKSIDTLLIIGGFIILLSVVISVLETTFLIDLLGAVFTGVLALVNMSSQLASAITRGAFEITLGCQAAGAAPADLADRLIAAGAIIGWSGLSVHAQVAALLHDTDINVVPYMFSRLIHGVLAGVVTWLLLPLAPALGAALSAAVPALAAHPLQLSAMTWTEIATASTHRFMLVSALFLGLGAAVCSLRAAR